jgi:EAL domain-containing protein (putative c-di-GMP-specific phosphodiesterase class I)/GGDEF domain-containing protein
MRGWTFPRPGPGPWLPTDGVFTLVAVAAIAGAAAAWGLGAVHLFVAAPVLLLGAAVLLARMRRQAAAEHLASILCDDVDGRARPLSDTLARLAARRDLSAHRQARTDPITDLPTREVLIEAMDADIAASCPPRIVGAIRFADFDRLALFDLAAANAALAHLARRLAAATRPTNVLAQIDRDGFGVWFREDDLQAASAEFRAIAYVAAQDITDGGATLTPTIDADTASFPRDGENASQLLVRATAALGGPAGIHGGEPRRAHAASTEAVREQFALEQDLARAIAEDQLSMVFQPVVDLSASRMIGAEALLRWNHPTLGEVPPARFIPTVEAVGLSESYGLWVLNAACREARRWQDEGLAGLKVAVNLSARQLLDPDLHPKIARTLQRHGLSPAALELELTETAAMVDADRTVQLFGELRAMGVSLAIDDFGAGYSSLSYLKNLPFDKLKIDREFVTDIQDRQANRAICKALIELGRGLGLLVLAEGVETDREVTVLRDLGCRVFQGFYFSRPLDGDAFLGLAKNPSWMASFDLPVQRAPQPQRRPLIA